MKNTIIWIVVAALLVGTVVGASILYNNLGDKYNEENDLGGGLEIFGDVTTAATTKKDQGADVTTQAQNDPQKPDNTQSQSTQSPSTVVTTAPEAPEAPKVTLSVPDFEVLDYNGNKVKLSDFAGRPIVINFWATWCYYCKEEMPDFDKAYKEYPDVVFLMVNATDGVSETVQSAKKYVEDEGYDFDIYFDTTEQALDAYGINSFPSTFFINANGELAARRIGMLDYEMLELGLSYIIK